MLEKNPDNELWKLPIDAMTKRSAPTDIFPCTTCKVKYATPYTSAPAEKILTRKCMRISCDSFFIRRRKTLCRMSGISCENLSVFWNNFNSINRDKDKKCDLASQNFLRSSAFLSSP